MSKILKYTVDNKNLMFIGPTTDGMIFGLCIKGIGDIHLIYMQDGENITKHISDKTTKPITYINIGKFPAKQINLLVEKHHKRWLKKYHGNKKCWITSGTLHKKINDEIINRPCQKKMPLEIITGQIVLDFDNPDRWERVGIRTLLGSGRIGFIKERGVIRMVEPINDNKMFCYSDQQFKNFSMKLVQMYGMEEYVDYVIDKYGQDKIDRMLDEKFSQ